MALSPTDPLMLIVSPSCRPRVFPEESYRDEIRSVASAGLKTVSVVAVSPVAIDVFYVKALET